MGIAGRVRVICWRRMGIERLLRQLTITSRVDMCRDCKPLKQGDSGECSVFWNMHCVAMNNGANGRLLDALTKSFDNSVFDFVCSGFEGREKVSVAVEFFNLVEDIVREFVRGECSGRCDLRIGVAICPCRLSVERARKRCLRLPERLEWCVLCDVRGPWIGVWAVYKRTFRDKS